LPGAPAYSGELQQRLQAALAAQGNDYTPRTEHLHEDGSPKFTNRLILESSPYLLQHAHNPVNWYAWGEEAFADARRLRRPILLSIGYSTCHWCHVMERESFEDEEIAAYLNANYIAIKVDREERPDLDAIYMSAVQSLTGRGGWPMTTWLTPDGEPFYGGTYFPARDGDRGSRKGFLTLLAELKHSYDAQPVQIAAQAKQIVERVRRSMAPATRGELPTEASVVGASEWYKSSFDEVHGGRRQRPKFPSNLPIRLLFRAYRRTGEAELRRMAELTLTKMAGGGMYDQVGGGFHRYSTDERWLVPHFEKMLYDNALLTSAYLEGYQVTGREDLAAVARDVLSYVAREMTAPGGAFYSATDADSLTPHGEMEEGWFFTWTPAEIELLLGAEDARRFQAYYGVTPRGNFEGRSILHVTRSSDEVARLLGLSVERLETSLATGREKLYAARAERPAPLRDDKILTSWNGLMISAMARGGFVLDEPDFVERARKAADFLLENSRRDRRLLRSFMDGQARHNAYLDDYSFLIAGLLDLHEVSHEARWLAEAIALQETLDRHYQDSKNGGFFMTSDDHESLLAREKPAYDGAEPSGNSVALMNLVRLHELTTDDRYRLSAENLLEGFGSTLRRSPNALSEMLLGLDFWLDSPKEIVISTTHGTEQAEPFLDVLRQTFLPNKVVVVVPQRGAESKAHAKLVPLTRGKVARKGNATAYVCERGVCDLPTTDVEVFSRQLERSPGAGAAAGQID
jgi:uncharacterized protein YyaL (SSP411 family)